MFTGLVTAIGTVRAAKQTARGRRLTISAPYRKLEIGESIAVSGACLTVIASGKGSFDVEAIGLTRGRTTIGDWDTGTHVNLERSVRAGDRLGGHLVSGHVDGVGTVLRREETGDSLLLDIKVPIDIAAVTVPRGSIAIDGVSLTVNAMPKKDIVQVALIPHTRGVTTLGRVAKGARVHLEADQVGKLVRQLLKPYMERR